MGWHRDPIVNLLAAGHLNLQRRGLQRPLCFCFGPSQIPNVCRRQASQFRGAVIWRVSADRAATSMPTRGIWAKPKCRPTVRPCDLDMAGQTHDPGVAQRWYRCVDAMVKPEPGPSGSRHRSPVVLTDRARTEWIPGGDRGRGGVERSQGARRVRVYMVASFVTEVGPAIEDPAPPGRRRGGRGPALACYPQRRHVFADRTIHVRRAS
jgi:hypothetical protein